jgi:hypothetical protein
MEGNGNRQVGFDEALVAWVLHRQANWKCGG